MVWARAPPMAPSLIISCRENMSEVNTEVCLSAMMHMFLGKRGHMLYLIQRESGNT